MRILLVEDDQFYLQIITELLVDRHISVTSALTGQEALEKDAQSFDGAVIDLMLPNDPDVSGITDQESRGGFYTGVCIARRLWERNKNIKVVLLTSNVFASDAQSWAEQNGARFVRKEDKLDSLLQALTKLDLLAGDQSPLAFIVHGHDETALLQLKNFVQNTLNWQQPVILREQGSNGKTLIEKFESFGAKVDCVFVLLTPDDAGFAPITDAEKRRSRQNVIFELGYFFALLGRQSGRILLLHRGPLELPSDISGMVWIDISGGISAAGEEIRREVVKVIGPTARL
jgi:predicted nucleotide-binding protein